MNDNRKYFLGASAGAALVSLLVLGVFNISSSEFKNTEADQTAAVSNASIVDTGWDQPAAVPGCIPADAVVAVSAGGGSCSVTFCSGATATVNRNMGTLNATLMDTSPELLAEYGDMCIGGLITNDDTMVPVARFDSNIVLDQQIASKYPDFTAQILSNLKEIKLISNGQNSFDASVVESIKKFQTENKLTVNGYVDIATYSAIKLKVAQNRMSQYVNIVDKNKINTR